jgi:hypothetical protein
MPTTQLIFRAIESGDLEAIGHLLDEDPGLVHVRHADQDLHHWTTLQFAAAKGQLAACRLLVDRGAEVYTNPMNTYPPVLQAAWNKHADVVRYFLEEIPDRAAGTNGLGIAINGAGSVMPRSIGRPTTITRRSWRCSWTPGQISKPTRLIATAVSRAPLGQRARAGCRSRLVGARGGREQSQPENRFGFLRHDAADHEPRLTMRNIRYRMFSIDGIERAGVGRLEPRNMT